jgi:hypothetical protein
MVLPVTFFTHHVRPFVFGIQCIPTFGAHTVFAVPVVVKSDNLFVASFADHFFPQDQKAHVIREKRAITRATGMLRIK